MYAAFERTSEVTSGRVVGAIEVYSVDPPRLESEPVASVPFHGAFDRRSGDFSHFIDWDGETEAAASDDAPTAILTETWTRRVGDRVYFKDGYWTGRLDSEADWISVPAERTDDILMPYLNEPSDFVAGLATMRSELSGAIVVNVDVSDSEMLDGEPTTHYHVDFDDQELPEDLTAADPARLQTELLIISLDVWVSDTGLLARVVLRNRGVILSYEGAAFAAGEGHQTVNRFDLFDLDTPIVIEPPPASQVTAIEDIEGSSFTEEG